MTSSYPERRPYATVTPNSGYLAKPLALSPSPPTEALRILTCQTGLDDLRSMRPRTTGGRLPAIHHLSASSDRESTILHHLVDPTLFPNRDRTSDEAMHEARLGEPFEFDASSYHSSQQCALNAQLRNKVEAFVTGWEDKVRQLHKVLEHYPTECALTNFGTLEALRAYFQAYRCTEDLTKSIQQLVEECGLVTPLDELDDIQSVAPMSLDSIRRSLDSLLNSNYLLAPLDQYLESLAPLDAIARAPEGQALSETDAACGPLRVSNTAVVLHEKLHYDPGEYSTRELMKLDGPLLAMEERVMTAKSRKEAAIDQTNPMEALRSLHAQVDFSNDLLLMNKSRMSLVALHSDDVREMRNAVVQIIEEARITVNMVKERALDLLPKVKKDMMVLDEEITKSHQHLDKLATRERETEAEMRAAMSEVDSNEKALWAELQAVMQKLMAASAQKAKLAQQRMSIREQQAKTFAKAQALLTTQRTHLERLTQCEGVLLRWEQGGEVYEKFVNAFVPKLLKRMNNIQEADEDLCNHEAQEYVRRYELFEYGVEEARAKRTVQADRMRLVRRAAALDQERVLETLDPHADVHAKKSEEADQELMEVQAYVEYIDNIERDRREEVEPVLQRVMALNLSTKTHDLCMSLDETTPAAIEACADGEAAVPVGPGAAVDHTHSSTASNAGLMATIPADMEGLMTATVTHPHIMARQVGIMHELAYNEKHRQLTDEELAAAESKIGGIRRSNAELKKMSVKYKNADYIRSLLSDNMNV